jgi:hypothetical protein
VVFAAEIGKYAFRKVRKKVSLNRNFQTFAIELLDPNSSVENCGAKVSQYIYCLRFLLSSLKLSCFYYALERP